MTGNGANESGAGIASRNTRKNTSGREYRKSAVALRTKNFAAELSGCREGLSLVLGGVNGICGLSDVCVTLMTFSGNIEVSGEGLLLSVFELGKVEIRGRVYGVRFDFYEKA